MALLACNPLMMLYDNIHMSLHLESNGGIEACLPSWQPSIRHPVTHSASQWIGDLPVR